MIHESCLIEVKILHSQSRLKILRLKLTKLKKIKVSITFHGKKITLFAPNVKSIEDPPHS